MELNNKVLWVCSEGGHLTEMLQLKPLILKSNHLILTENSLSARNQLLGMNAKFVFKGSRAEGFKYVLKFFINITRIFLIVWKFKPDLVISTGSAIAVPSFIFGKMFRARTIFIETFCRVKTKPLTTKLIGGICDLLLVQWPDKVRLYNKQNCKYIGSMM